MSDETCPQCGEGPLVQDGGFCRACGWDAELMGAHYRAEDAELPDEDDDYEDFLRREGLGGGGGRGGGALPWPVWVGLVVAIGLTLVLALYRR